MKQKEILNEISKTRYQENPENIIKHQKARYQENKKTNRISKMETPKKSCVKIRL